MYGIWIDYAGYIRHANSYVLKDLFYYSDYSMNATHAATQSIRESLCSSIGELRPNKKGVLPLSNCSFSCFVGMPYKLFPLWSPIQITNLYVLRVLATAALVVNFFFNFPIISMVMFGSRIPSYQCRHHHIPRHYHVVVMR